MKQASKQRRADVAVRPQPRWHAHVAASLARSVGPCRHRPQIKEQLIPLQRKTRMLRLSGFGDSDAEIVETAATNAAVEGVVPSPPRDERARHGVGWGRIVTPRRIVAAAAVDRAFFSFTIREPREREREKLLVHHLTFAAALIMFGSGGNRTRGDVAGACGGAHADAAHIYPAEMVLLILVPLRLDH